MVNPYMLCLWMGFNKQTAAAKGLHLSYNLPCVLRMALWIAAPRSNQSLSKMGRSSNRAEFRICPVCASAWMRLIACFYLGHLFFCHTVHNHHIVLHVGCHLYVPLGCVPAAVMQESLCFYLRDLQIL